MYPIIFLGCAFTRENSATLNYFTVSVYFCTVGSYGLEGDKTWFDSREKQRNFLLSKIFRLIVGPICWLWGPSASWNVVATLSISEGTSVNSKNWNGFQSWSKHYQQPSYKNSFGFLMNHSLDVESQRVFLSYRTLIGHGLSSDSAAEELCFWKLVLFALSGKAAQMDSFHRPGPYFRADLIGWGKLLS
jgi:hypothetical protein